MEDGWRGGGLHFAETRGGGGDWRTGGDSRRSDRRLHDGAGGEANGPRNLDGVDTEKREPADVYVVHGDSGFDCADRVAATWLFKFAADRDAAGNVRDVSAAGDFHVQRAAGGLATGTGGVGVDGDHIFTDGAISPDVAAVGGSLTGGGCFLHLCDLGFRGEILAGARRAVEGAGPGAGEVFRTIILTPCSAGGRGGEWLPTMPIVGTYFSGTNHS